MEIRTIEILDGVKLKVMQTDKFKTAYIGISFVDELSKAHHTKNAILPFLMRAGTQKYKTRKELSRALHALYGASISPNVRKYGDKQVFGFSISVLKDRFTFGGEVLREKCIEILADMILNPVLHDGGFREESLKIESENLKELILSKVNDKRTYAQARCTEELAAGEPFALSEHGDTLDLEKLNGKELYDHLCFARETLPIKICYIGYEKPEKVAEEFKKALSGLKRTPVKLIQSLVKKGTGAEKKVKETMDVRQCKLSIGCRTGISMADADYFPLIFMNCVFGAGPTSKLFMNVREKLSLCYYCSSAVERHKGIMTINSGVEKDKLGDTIKEIKAQLSDMKNGNIEDEEIEAARKLMLSSIKGRTDSTYMLENFLLSEALGPNLKSLDEYKNGILKVTKEDIVRVANKVEIDLIYTLEPKGETEND